jgi:hypothetical protein
MHMGRASDFVKIRDVGRVAHLTIDHPPLNTVSGEILQELARVKTHKVRPPPLLPHGFETLAMGSGSSETTHL